MLNARVRPLELGIWCLALALLIGGRLHICGGPAFDLGGLATRLLFVWTILNAQVVQFATSITTESLFTSLSLGAVLLFTVALRQRPERANQFGMYLAANALVGVSYWVRYAGL